MRFHHQFETLVSLPCAGFIVTLYLLMGFLGNRAMSDREPCNMSTWKTIYNAVQVVVCSVTFSQLLPYFVSAKHSYGIGLEASETIEFWVFVYYCCKVLDLGDTVFMVLGKKARQITLLHVWHHASIIPLFSWYLSTGKGAGSISALPLLNSLIHVFMYSHYLFVTLAPNIRPWWKPLLTASQICQHLILMVYMLTNWVYASNREITQAVFISGMLWGVSILGLFANFYVQQYINGGKPKKG